MNKENKSILKELYLVRSRGISPNLPEFARVTPTIGDNTANGLTRAVVDFLTMSGHQAERINTMGRIIQKGVKSTYIPTTGTKGSADISATIKGRSVKIEIKIGKDKQSIHQIAYQEAIERAGGIYVVVKSFDQFMEWYKNLNL